MKKFFSLVLALVMALSLTTAAWGADPVVVDVDNADELIAWAASAKTVDVLNINADIDLSGAAWQPVDLWNPEGGDVVINGNGYTISGMTVTGEKQIGFIGSFAGKSLTINALTFDNASVVASGSYAGVVIGYQYGVVNMNNVAVTNSVVESTAQYGIAIGGLVGFSVQNDGAKLNLSNCTVENCDVIGYHSVGGLVGVTKVDAVQNFDGCEVTDNTIVYKATGGVGASDYGAGSGGYSALSTSGTNTVANDVTMPVVINGVGYPTLAAAVAAAQDGDTIVLKIDNDEDVAIDDAVIIDPNGRDYTGTVTTADGKEVVLTAGKLVVAPKTSAAGSTVTLKDADKYDIYPITGTTSVKKTDADITKKVTSNISVTKDGKTTTTYTATTYSDGANVFVEVAATAATHKLTQNGAIVAYLVNLADVGQVPVTTTEVDSYVAAVEEPACGEYDKAFYPLGVYVIDDVAYKAGGANWAVLNGQFVNYGGKATPVAHKYVAATYSSTKHTDVDTVKCSECKATWDVLTAAEVATLSPKAFKQVDVKVGTGTQKLYIAVAANVVAGTPSTDKVTSAETFDAGIAMYVGMSVMAAAGSVVVLKKRED